MIEKFKRSNRSIEEVTGVIVPVITPATKAGKIDTSGLEQVLDFLLGSGIKNIFLFGTMGEGTSLAREEKELVLETSVKKIGGRANLLVGLGGASFGEYLNIVKMTEKYHPTAYVATLPCYYYLKEREIINFFTDLAGETAVPVFAYNIPFFVKNVITSRIAITLFEKGIIAGLKDSSDDWGSLQEIIFYAKENKEIRVYVGDERFFLAGGLIGVSGFVSAGANIMPETVVRFEKTCRAGHKEEALKLYRFMLTVRDLYNAASSGIANIKAIAEIMGLCERWMFRPMDSLSNSQFQCLKKVYLSLIRSRPGNKWLKS